MTVESVQVETKTELPKKKRLARTALSIASMLKIRHSRNDTVEPVKLVEVLTIPDVVELRNRLANPSDLSEKEQQILIKLSMEKFLDGANESMSKVIGGRAELHRAFNHTHYMSKIIDHDNDGTDGYVLLDEVALNVKNLRNSSHFLNEDLKRVGVVMKSHEDLAALRLIAVAAHEGGHRFSQEIAKDVFHRPKQLSAKVHSAYLAHQPEHAMTGIWEVDAPIHDERFSEGIARIATAQAALELGYDPKDVDTISYIISGFYSETVTTEKLLGAIQQAREEGATPGQVVEAAQPYEQLLERAVYPGELGYHSPLSEQEIFDELAYFSDVFVDFEKYAHHKQKYGSGFSLWSKNYADDPSLWAQAVLSTRGGSEHSEITRRMQFIQQ